MANLFGKHILIIIPKSQFCEVELIGVRNVLQQGGANVVVLSKSGQATMRKFMEQFVHLSRFILCCNELDKVIE